VRAVSTGNDGFRRDTWRAVCFRSRADEIPRSFRSSPLIHARASPRLTRQHCAISLHFAKGREAARVRGPIPARDKQFYRRTPGTQGNILIGVEFSASRRARPSIHAGYFSFSLLFFDFVLRADSDSAT